MNSEYKKINTNDFSNILWVGDKYRTNSQSLQPGGYNVIVFYADLKVLGYDNIKSPDRYIAKIFEKNIINDIKTFSDIEKLELIKKKVAKIFIKDLEKKEYGEDVYIEAWDNVKSDELPNVAIQKYERNYFGSL